MNLVPGIRIPHMQKSSISQMLHCFPFPNTLLEPSVSVLSKIWRITSSLGERANTQSTQDPLVLGFLASLQEHFFSWTHRGSRCWTISGLLS